MKTRLQIELPELLKQDSGFRQWLEQSIRQTTVTPESFSVNMIRLEMPFNNDYFLMACPFVKEVSGHSSDLTVAHFPPLFANANNMLFASPFRVTQTFCPRECISVVEGTIENPTDRQNGQTHVSPTAWPGGLPISLAHAQHCNNQGRTANAPLV